MMQKKISGGWAIEYDLLDDKKDYTLSEKISLLEQLLDSESNMFSTKVRDWLMKPGMLSILIGFITRVPEGEEPVSPWDSSVSSDEFVISSNRRRDALLAESAAPKDGEDSDSEMEEELQFSVEAKRADKAAEVLVYQTSAFPEEFMDKNFENLVCDIFKIFRLDARGDFDNFDKIFEKVFAPRAAHLCNVLSRHEKMVLHLLNYLHEATVAEVLMALMRLPLPEKLLVNFYNHLNSEKFLPYLGQKLYGTNAESSFEDAGAFFTRLVELCSTFSNADILFTDIARDFAFVNGLMDAIGNKSGRVSKEQQVACIYALKALLVKSGEQLFDASLEAYAPTPLPNMLAGIHDELHEHLKSQITTLCNVVLEEAKVKGPQEPDTVYSSYTVKKRFTLHRMALLDILVELTDNSPAPVLSAILPEVWRVLTEWLFDHKFNNVYHGLFLKLFKIVMKANHAPTLKTILSRYKFLTKLVRHFETHGVTDTGLRGFIILMTNIIRLTSDALPASEYINTFLHSNEIWKNFLVVLREATIAQHVTQFSAPVGGGHISPFALHDAFGSFGGLSKCKPVNPEDVDIDLGSDYANQLGFWDVVAYSATAAGNKRKRNRRRKGKGPNAGADGEADGDDTSAAKPDNNSSNTHSNNNPKNNNNNNNNKGNNNNKSNANNNNNNKNNNSKKTAPGTPPGLRSQQHNGTASTKPTSNNTTTPTDSNSSTPTTPTATTMASRHHHSHHHRPPHQQHQH
eukprot:TRINITY_DN2397_c0_g1_i3.p1 TRINITY_DN2397_c0_g1~~TRINITY_DN2397_c0_g1_i3.p1  ORF type:complete len:742 (+),score=202.89 TRINITY_DN2397_c0_g1_i3:141-2366(+)